MVAPVNAVIRDMSVVEEKIKGTIPEVISKCLLTNEEKNLSLVMFDKGVSDKYIDFPFVISRQEKVFVPSYFVGAVSWVVTKDFRVKNVSKCFDDMNDGSFVLFRLPDTFLFDMIRLDSNPFVGDLLRNILSYFTFNELRKFSMVSSFFLGNFYDRCKFMEGMYAYDTVVIRCLRDRLSHRYGFELMVKDLEGKEVYATYYGTNHMTEIDWDKDGLPNEYGNFIVTKRLACKFFSINGYDIGNMSMRCFEHDVFICKDCWDHDSSFDRGFFNMFKGRFNRYKISLLQTTMNLIDDFNYVNRMMQFHGYFECKFSIVAFIFLRMLNRKVKPGFWLEREKRKYEKRKDDDNWLKEAMVKSNEANGLLCRVREALLAFSRRWAYDYCCSFNPDDYWRYYDYFPNYFSYCYGSVGPINKRLQQKRMRAVRMFLFRKMRLRSAYVFPFGSVFSITI